MRAWWWILFTAHLVWGNPEQSEADDHGYTDNLGTNRNGTTEKTVFQSLVLIPKDFYKGISYEGNKRGKRQMGFHSWGGKRYGYEGPEEIRDNSDLEGSAEFNEPGDEDFMTEVSLYPPLNVTDLETDGLGERFRETFTKRVNLFPAFFSWGGSREPDLMNDLSKTSNFFSPESQRKNSKSEQSTKRFPYFYSGAGKRSSGFKSWGGKRDYLTENIDYSSGTRDYSKAKKGFSNDTGNQVSLKNENIVRTNLNSISLDAEDNLNFQDQDPEINKGGEHFSRTVFKDKEHSTPGEQNFISEFVNQNLKRAAAFNSWAGKRISEDKPLVVKKPVSFNSWAGKRATAFNSWGGKRAAAFNSWGGKRAAAFNSWGGKRAAAFNSWGGKRAAAFNSWGGKRYSNKRNENPKFEYPVWTINRVFYGVQVPVIKSHDKHAETKTKEFLHNIDNSNQAYIFKHTTGKYLDKLKENSLKNRYYVLLHNNQGTNTEPFTNHEQDSNQNNLELLEDSARLEKRTRPSSTSWAGKRSTLFSSWYGGKFPTVLLTNGKRRPAFSSWGGKRSEHKTDSQLDCSPENTVSKDTTTLHKQDEELVTPDGKTYTRKKRGAKCSDEKNTSVLTIERDKRASGHFLKNRVFTRMMLQGGWPMAFQSMSNGKNFFAWGGKRSFDTTLQ